MTGLGLSNRVLYEGFKKNDIAVDIINTEITSEVSTKQGSFSLHKLTFLLFYLGLYKIIRKDTIYITTGQTFFGVVKYLPFLVFSKMLSKKCVVHLHGNALYSNYKQLSKWKKRLFCKTMRLYDRGIVLSKSLKYNLDPFIAKQNIYVEHNFISDDLIVNAATKNYSEYRLVFLSNLIRDKGINEFLKALKTLDEKGFKYSCKIAGSVPEDNSGIIEIMRLLPRVEYLGVVDGSAKQELLNWSNLFCLPTKLPEGQPISIIEALCFGNLILATNTPGISDLINKSNGILLEGTNADHIAQSISSLTLENLESIGTHNLHSSKNQFSQNQFVKRILAIL
jgi:glycosyltransferase involved in cell wall biosynthesis